MSISVDTTTAAISATLPARQRPTKRVLQLRSAVVETEHDALVRGAANRFEHADIEWSVE